LFDIQEEFLDVGDPLTCLWADMIKPDREANKAQFSLLVQRALVLLGNNLLKKEKDHLGKNQP